MPGNDGKRTLVERIRAYHEADKPRDGSGGTLAVVKMAELGEGVACVHDSLGEIDLFFDTDDWQLVDVAKGRYRLFLGSAQEGITQYGKMRERYGMVCVVQDRWNPTSFQCRTSFSQALEAARALLRPRNPDCHLYDTPRVMDMLH